MFKRLSNKEIEKAINAIDKNLQKGVYLSDKRIAQAQLEYDKKQFIEWGEETCHHLSLKESSTYYLKRACDLCWQGFKEG